MSDDLFEAIAITLLTLIGLFSLLNQTAHLIATRAGA